MCVCNFMVVLVLCVNMMLSVSFVKCVCIRLC